MSAIERLPIAECHERQPTKLALFCTSGEKMDSIYLIDEYASVAPGDPFRLFPFGRIVKGGKAIDFTREMAAKFRLPHFKPPIKRGSHAEDAPAAGFIVGLEVREDGLYAIPEYNEKGLQTVQDGDYRYQSPEVVWGDGPVFEDPTSGKYIHGPLVVGDALLHTPHLGEGAALYSVTTIQEETDMSEMETVQVPKTFWDQFVAFFQPKREPEPAPEPEPAADVEQFEAAKAEAAAYKAELDTLKAEATKKERVDKYTAAVKETRATHDLGELLAGLPDETADRILQEFKALSAQIKESNLTDELGTGGEGADSEGLLAAIKTKVAGGMNYNQAFEAVRAENPELVTSYQEGK